MLRPDDIVGTSIIFAEDTLKQRIPRARHSHGYGQQAHDRGFRGKVSHRVAVAAHTGIIVEITGTGHSHAGEQKQIGPAFLHGADGHLKFRTVNRVGGVKADDAIPPQLLEKAANLRRCHTQLLKFKMKRQIQHFQGPADIVFTGISK